MKQTVISVALVVCVACLCISSVCARPYEGQLSNKDRQDILHYAAKIVRIVVGDEAGLTTEDKRNSGMLDAVIQMPDLFKAGRK